MHHIGPSQVPLDMVHMRTAKYLRDRPVQGRPQESDLAERDRRTYFSRRSGRSRQRSDGRAGIHRVGAARPAVLRAFCVAMAPPDGPADTRPTFRIAGLDELVARLIAA